MSNTTQYLKGVYVHYLSFLETLHQIIDPEVYFEIGVRKGASFKFGRTTVIGVDPSYQIESEISKDAHLFKKKSDDFFAGTELRDVLGARKINFAFIDGWHNFEFALRDFMNTERYADKDTIVVFDDVRPRTEKEAVRVPHGGAWTGDVWKVAVCLQKYRPDLKLTFAGTKPTGLLVVQNLSPKSTILSDAYAEIEANFISDDYPLMPPAEYLDGFIAPEAAVELVRDTFKPSPKKVQTKKRKSSKDQGASQG